MDHGHRNGTQTVLIVDDDQLTNAMLNRLLGGNSLTIISAFSVREAVSCVRQHNPDLILLDVGLPDGSGFDIFCELQAHPITLTPVIVISAEDDTALKLKAFEAGAIDYITKPIVPSEVLARVRTQLRLKAANDTLAAMHERDQTFQAIANAALDAMLMMDPQGTLTFYNRAAEQMFGWSAAEALGANLHQLLMPDRYLQAMHKGIAEFQESGTGNIVGVTREVTARAKGGREFPIEISVSAVQLHDGWNAVGIVRDITERKQADAALRASEDQYRLLFEGSEDAIVVIDPPQWEISAANSASIRLFQLQGIASFQSLRPWHVSPEYQPDGQPSDEKAIALLKQTMRDGGAFFDWRYKRSDGVEFDASVRLTRITRTDKTHILATIRENIPIKTQSEA